MTHNPTPPANPGRFRVLPRALGRTLYAYVGVSEGCHTTLEISPGPISGVDPEDVVRTWDNLEAVVAQPFLDRAVREADRREKEAWLVEARAQIVDGSTAIEELVDLPFFPEDLIVEQFA